MDNITHSLVGALIGQAGLKRRTGLAMSALIIGANLPDVDFVTYFLEGNQHLALRRGITHGPIAWVLLPLLLAGALWWFDRWQGRRGTRPEGRLPVRFGWLYALGFIACLTHPALDWLNVYGVRLLEPFSSRWFYGDTLFIIDIWLWVGLGFAMWLSLRRERLGGEWRRPALIAIAVALLYINANTAISKWAVSGYHNPPSNVAIASPVPFAFWRREMITHKGKSDPSGVILSDWSVSDGWSAKPIQIGEADILLGCVSLERLAVGNPQLSAFLFWSRVPVTGRNAAGEHVLRDARYFDPRARDRFSVTYEPIDCYEPATR